MGAPPPGRAQRGASVSGVVAAVLLFVAIALLPVLFAQARRSVLPTTIALIVVAMPLAFRRSTLSSNAVQAVLLDHKGKWVLAAVTLIALPLLSGSYVPIYGYLAKVAVGMLAFLVILAAVARFDDAALRISAQLERYRVPLLALLFLVLAAAAALLVFDNVPHVSDEVAYQFQARALASGKLYVQPPAEFQFFDFVHMINDGAKWYGIMNPGWPAVLAVGYAIRAPWLINPVLGALTLLVLFSFFKRAGYSLLESRLAVLLLAVSPLVLFMSGTYMAHTVNLFLFAVFLWAWIRLLNEHQFRFALLAGAAIALNLLVRPIDTAAVCAPFLLYLGVQSLRKPRFLPHVVVLGAVAALGVVITWAYNQQLTGDWRLMPMSKYFTELNPNEKFGLGFGPDMGTKIHGPEWPGYYPSDAVRVTSYRLEEFLRDFNGMPLLLITALLIGLRRIADWRQRTTHVLLLTSALVLIGIYIFHFYHGIAYGSRHYFLAVPAVAAGLARLLAGWMESNDPIVSRRARLVLVAGLLYTVTFPYGSLIAEYGRNYRGSSGALRAAVNDRGLSNAVVFVAQGGLWGWKSAFPLNTYPLDRSSVIYAKDLGAQNEQLVRRFPERQFYLAQVRGSGVQIQPLPGRQPFEPVR